ncbi:MAG: bifunctional riboflavin kinase/FAD synthetase [Oscillospiraceae bacterium]|nr:bifunctional riboflavin kinase/FAD synthetase [Oscillospiraceae bacterium]
MVAYDRLVDAAGETAVALGIFDGLHRGHRAVVERVVAEKENGLVPTVLTFSTDQCRPARKQGMKRILTNRLFLRLLEETGVELVESLPFEGIMNLSPREFVEQVLCGRLKAKAVACGQDFRFGKGAAGDLPLLQKLCGEYGIRLDAVPSLLDGGEAISSTRIRQCLSEGEIELANWLLGHPYSLDFEVVHGNELGRTIGIPTINQIFAEQFLVPRFGAYASYTELRGKRYKSITNIGVKPTIQGNRLPLAETHIMGVDESLYGQNIRVSLMKFIRPEKKFESFEELTEEIRANIRQIDALLD